MQLLLKSIPSLGLPSNELADGATSETSAVSSEPENKIKGVSKNVKRLIIHLLYVKNFK